MLQLDTLEVPETQSAVPFGSLQVLPQEPQLETLVDSFTQTPLQAV